MVKRDSLYRLRLIDEALQSHNGVTIDRLKEIIEVTSNSTIRNYIGYRQQANVDPMFRKGIMWGEFWPERMIEKYNPNLTPESFNDIIVKEGGRYKYAYSDFSLFNNEFTKSTIESIFYLIEYFQRVMGLNDNFEHVINALYEMLESQKGGRYKDRLDKIINSKSTMKISLRQVFSMESNFYREHITFISESIRKKIALEITYKPFNDPRSTITIHPYFLCESNSRWYVIGQVSDVKEKTSPFIKYNRVNKINNLALERVSEIKIAEAVDYINSPVDVENILENSFGPSISDWENPLVIDLVIKTRPELQKHFETMPLKFNAKQSNDGCIFTYKNTVVSSELINSLLQFGSGIEILEPKKVRDEFIGELKKLNAGDYLLIPAYCKHRVDWTDPKQESIWLALHFKEIETI